MSDLVVDRELALLYEPSLIVSDSQRSCNAVRDAVQQRLAPRDFVEHMWAAELIDGEWETLRLRRFKTMIVTSARLPALQNLLTVLLENSHDNDRAELAERFFTNSATKFYACSTSIAPAWQCRARWILAKATRRIDHGNRTADCCQPQKRVQEHRT
jgi:hypothetical protein